MARLLNENVLQQHIADTLSHWASSASAQRPCGQDIWQYVCAVSGVEAPELPPHQSRADLLKLLKKEKGLANYAHKLVTSVGWVKVEGPPTLGDVAIINIHGMGETCVVSMSNSWAIRGDYSVLSVLHNACPIVGIWRFI